MKKKTSILKNQYIYSILSKTIILISGFLFTVAQARYLGAEIKGQVSYVASITSITSIIFGFGLHQAYPYYKKQTEEDLLPIFLKITQIQLLAYIVFSVGLTLLFQEIKLLCIFLSTPIMVYNRIISYITMIEEPNRKNTTDIIISLCELCVIIVFWMICPPSVIIGVIVLLFKEMGTAVIFTWRWREKSKWKNISIRKWIIKLYRFGFFPMLALLMTTLNYRIDIIMLEGRTSDAAIGIYSVGVMLAERLWLIPDAMKEVMISKITKGKSKDEVSFVIRICNTVCLVFGLAIIALGKPALTIIFGAEYSGAYEVTLILLTGVFFMTYYKMIASYNIIIGKQKINFIFLGISVIGNVIANILLIPAYGIYGAGMASVISYGICSVLFIVQFKKVSGIPLINMLFAKPSEFKQIKKRVFKEE